LADLGLASLISSEVDFSVALGPCSSLAGLIGSTAGVTTAPMTEVSSADLSKASAVGSAEAVPLTYK